MSLDAIFNRPPPLPVSGGRFCFPLQCFGQFRPNTATCHTAGWKINALWKTD